MQVAPGAVQVAPGAVQVAPGCADGLRGCAGAMQMALGCASRPGAVQVAHGAVQVAPRCAGAVQVAHVLCRWPHRSLLLMLFQLCTGSHHCSSPARAQHSHPHPNHLLFAPACEYCLCFWAYMSGFSSFFKLPVLKYIIFV